ncbi:hypothetical protein N7519_010661 [Penicillium mononematosum]|uniref:uncharacterized protein n=1 Tax=Penicillium mononematosum TaxID=268346 RepID=UPI002546FE3A|nr:uncharacterized protein N7519_010661 [Penicillium mononematosum]KAJ6180200.1 hypothetical protein N7519_010661 [Penicillium mononematosum]
MSFGFGVGDFLAVIKLSLEIRKAFVGAPAQFESISNEVRSLSLVLQDVDTDISAKELSSEQQTELNELLAGCHEVLAEVSRRIEDYTELSKTNDGKRNIAKRAWKRLKWEPSDVQELRLRISTNIALLTAYNAQLMKRGVGKLVKHQDEEARQKVLDWLSSSNYATQQSDYISRREEGTGQWFLDTSEFKSWISGSKQTLFCPGIPASIVVDELYDQFGSGGEVAIAYLYCSFMRHGEQSSQSSLPSSIQEMYTKHTAKGTRPSIGEISKTIQAVSNSSDFAKVYIVIDALDECRMDDGSRTSLLDAMFELQDGGSINLLATSRFIPEITERFKGKPALEIRASTADVMRYLRGNLAMLPFVSRESGIANGDFDGDNQSGGWDLYLNSLVGKRSPKAIRSALKDISSSTKQYDSAYSDAMKRIQGQVSDQAELAMQVLAWITCAKRPLTTVELQTALAVEIDESVFDEDNVPDLIDVVSVCAGLVTIDEESNVIRLVHYTTQEFFQRNQSTWFPKANYYIGSICVAYLSFDTFIAGHCRAPEDFESRLYRYPFAPYAANFWGSHVRECEADGEQPISEAIIALLPDRSKVDSCMQFAWYASAEFSFNMPFYDSRRGMMGLHLAAYFELLDVAQTLISLGNSVDCVDVIGRTPLLWAAGYDRRDAITFLLANGADPNIEDDAGTTPLFSAVEKGHERAVQLLLEENCDLQQSAFTGLSLLHASAIGGSEKIARLLLMRGLSAYQKDKGGRTPLYFAAEKGHLDMVRLFLDWDVDDDPQHIELNAFLSEAAKIGDVPIVQLLLDRGADPNTRDRGGQTPLICATESNAKSVMQLLLKRGVELEIKDHEGRTALSLAAGNRSTELLLENGADINTEDNLGRGVVFHAASENTYAYLTDLFTSTKIRNVHQPDRYGRTPLHVATALGNLLSVSALLKSDGVDCEAQDEFGRTALSDAIMRKKFDTVKVLETFSETRSQVTVESMVEPTSQRNTTICCDVCMAYVLEGEAFYHCDTCDGANFDICEVCYYVGARCLDRSHKMELRHGQIVE